MLLAPAFSALLCALPLAARAAPQEPGDQPATAHQGVEVTFLANSGFQLRSGPYSVLIDAFLRDPVAPYSALTPEIHKDLVAARTPFDGITAVLVSHVHGDHVQIRGLERYLLNNEDSLLMSSPPLVRALKEEARDYQAIQKRVNPIRVVTGTPTKLEQTEVSIEFLVLPHVGKLQGDSLNLAHLIEMGGVRLMHLGDADPAPVHFRSYDLPARQIDVAMVPYWFFGSPEGLQTLRDEVRPRIVIACHVPPADWEKVNSLLQSEFPGVILFQDSLEKRIFLPRGTASTDEEERGG